MSDGMSRAARVVWWQGFIGALVYCCQCNKCMSRSGLDKTNEPHGLAQLGGVSGEKLKNI